MRMTPLERQNTILSGLCHIYSWLHYPLYLAPATIFSRQLLCFARSLRALESQNVGLFSLKQIKPVTLAYAFFIFALEIMVCFLLRLLFERGSQLLVERLLKLTRCILRPWHELLLDGRTQVESTGRYFQSACLRALFGRLSTSRLAGSLPLCTCPYSAHFYWPVLIFL